MEQRPLRERAWPYGAWFVFLAAAEAVTYAIDPFVFAFAVLWLGAATALVALCGLLSWAFAKKPRPLAAVGWSFASVAASVTGFWFLLLVSWRC
jgi:hypothetical protein